MWNADTDNIEINNIVQLDIIEDFESAHDADGQTYEDCALSYKTAGFRISDNTWKILLPKSPEKNLDDMFSEGILYALAITYDNETYEIKSIGDTKRKIKIKGWQNLSQ